MAIHETTEQNIKSNKLDYSSYLYNNWRIAEDNAALNILYKRGGAIWLTKNANVCCKFSKNEIPIELNFKKAQQRFLSELNIEVTITEKLPKKIDYNEGNKIFYISLSELMTVQNERLNPWILQEFYKKDGLYYRNIFQPTKYMKLDARGQYSEPKAILNLIYHLVRYDDQRFNYFINWLAYFFQDLKKSQVSIVLLGNQGAGKGILFTKIIQPLFGLEYCTTINDTSLNTKYKAGIIKNKLFFNFDESSHSKNSNTKNFLKAIITNDSISAEEKNITMEKEIELFAQSLFTSNDPNPIEIEESDRRYTVFTTGDNLTYNNFLGYQSYENLASLIEEQLEDFAIYLKKYIVSEQTANKVLFTPEKKVIINSCTDNFKDFLNAILYRNIIYFEEIYYKNAFLYQEIINDIYYSGRVKKQNLHLAYAIIFKGETNKISAKKLLKTLRLHAPTIFDDANAQRSNGNLYYLLPIFK